MSTYKLYYLPYYIRGEPLRLLLTHAKVDFEDLTDFGSYKHLMPNGQVPVLELQDGTKLFDTVALLNFLAKRHGYYPKDDIIAAKSDALMLMYNNDYFKKLHFPFFLKDEAKEAPLAELMTALPEFLAKLETNLGTGTKFLYGDELTVADFFIGSFYTDTFANKSLGLVPEFYAACLEKAPLFAAYGERFVEANKEYLDTRKQYPI